jgi:hypothetical protein
MGIVSLGHRVSEWPRFAAITGSRAVAPRSLRCPEGVHAATAIFGRVIPGSRIGGGSLPEVIEKLAGGLGFEPRLAESECNGRTG